MPQQLYTIPGIILGAALGISVSAGTKYVINLGGYVSWISAGAILGILIFPALGPAFSWLKRRGLFDCIQTATIGGVEFHLTSPQRTAAWHIFIELMSRVSTQNLGADEGNESEALDSLYSLFQKIRETLRNMPPTPNAKTGTVEHVALVMLNRDIRPFLSKWHPRRSELREKTKENFEGITSNEMFHTELLSLQSQLLKKAKVFGELAEVSDLNGFFSTTNAT